MAHKGRSAVVPALRCQEPQLCSTIVGVFDEGVFNSLESDKGGGGQQCAVKQLRDEKKNTLCSMLFTFDLSKRGLLEH